MLVDLKNVAKSKYARVAFAIFTSLSICAGGCDGDSGTGGSASSSSTATRSDTEALQAQANRLEKIEITVSAPVEKILQEDNRGLPHQRFLIRLSNGSTILVANDLKYGTFVPLQPGDFVTIRGEYIWNRRGGVLHWTHKSDEPKHQGGWIELNGKRYQ